MYLSVCKFLFWKRWGSIPCLFFFLFFFSLNAHSRKLEFVPTLLPDIKSVYDVFDRMRTDYQEQAQCSNMAHVWTYEEFKESGTKAMKVFLFFTNRYIKKYRFEWWFHVAPLYFYKDGEKIIPQVLDRRYTTLPLDVDTWTEHFIESGKRCKKIMHYREYNRNDRNEDCFVLPVSMYYWQPRNIRLDSKSGKVKTQFHQGELNRAYTEAF